MNINISHYPNYKSRGSCNCDCPPRTKICGQKLSESGFFLFAVCDKGQFQAKEDGIPLSMVLERILDIKRVINIPSKITHVIVKTPKNDEKRPVEAPAIKIADIAIKVGKRPLHGTNTLVIIAINLSLGNRLFCSQ